MARYVSSLPVVKMIAFDPAANGLMTGFTVGSDFTSAFGGSVFFSHPANASIMTPRIARRCIASPLLCLSALP